PQIFFGAALCCFVASTTANAGSPVWKVTSADGGTLYVGGSVHALKRSDYPLPAAFNHALDNSSHVVFETEEPTAEEAKYFTKAAEYTRGDSLQKHVDPRTYAYLKRLFSLVGVPEGKFNRYNAWALTLFLQSPSHQGLSSDLGVEGYLAKRAKARKKPVSGLVSAREHFAVYTDLTAKQAEAVLLLTLIPQADVSRQAIMKAWRRGDTDYLWRMSRESYSDYPAFAERILEARNRAWIPKLEGYLRSGKTHFVVVGAAHLGGPEGVLALLRDRGYSIEQL
ncbi:MAG TPA: TraB/GumN family protein, partial [Chthoniobacterales bacterium]|nr:TraB/GumN family protein [Chthoniobacterales bacterium]